MFIIKLVTLISITLYVKCEEESKWVWNKNDGGDRTKERALLNDRYFDGPGRYETYEEVDDLPLYNRPLHPSGYPPGGVINRPPGGIINRPPGISRPPAFIPQDRPDGLYFGGNDNYGQGGGSPDILTGPVPSWVQAPPFKQFDTCKCAERFNCKSPGISYGHCDTGKQYCCYNKRGTIHGSLPPSRPIHSPDNGILVGPGGPFDTAIPHQHHHRPPYHRPRPPNDIGVLVGPGGPTGIIGRPPQYGPNYGNSNGILVGPGVNGGGFGYGRSKN